MSPLPPARLVTLPPRADADGRPEEPVTLSVRDTGPETGAADRPAVMLSHGFPELAWSWRHQIPALAAAGFRVVAPDQRGYGDSDRPEAVDRYDIGHLTGDLAGLLEALSIERAVVVGHDWGGFVAWAMPILHPERIAGVIGVNTPYLPRSPVPPTQALRLAQPDPEKLYMLWFQEPGVAEAVLDPRARRCFEVLMRHPPPPEELAAHLAEHGGDMNPFRRLDEAEPLGEPLLSEEELDVYVRAFERTGFAGGIHWYRNLDRNWERWPEVGVAKIDLPCLMVTAEWDFALRPEMADGMPALCGDLETVRIDRCGHWTQQEAPDELNRILVDWLGRRFGG